MKRPLAYITAAWSGDKEADRNGLPDIAGQSMKPVSHRFAPCCIFRCISMTPFRRSIRTGLICAGIYSGDPMCWWYAAGLRMKM